MQDINWLNYSQAHYRDLMTGSSHETKSHPRSVKYLCIIAFNYASLIWNVTLPKWDFSDVHCMQVINFGKTNYPVIYKLQHFYHGKGQFKAALYIITWDIWVKTVEEWCKKGIKGQIRNISSLHIFQYFCLGGFGCK